MNSLRVLFFFEAVVMVCCIYRLGQKLCRLLRTRKYRYKHLLLKLLVPELIAVYAFICGVIFVCKPEAFDSETAEIMLLAPGALITVFWFLLGFLGLFLSTKAILGIHTANKPSAWWWVLWIGVLIVSIAVIIVYKDDSANILQRLFQLLF